MPERATSEPLATKVPPVLVSRLAGAKFHHLVSKRAVAEVTRVMVVEALVVAAPPKFTVSKLAAVPGLMVKVLEAVHGPRKVYVRAAVMVGLSVSVLKETLLLPVRLTLASTAMSILEAFGFKTAEGLWVSKMLLLEALVPKLISEAFGLKVPVFCISKLLAPKL